MKKKKGGKEVAFRPQTIIEARYDLDRRQNDILDILLGIVGEGDDTEENTRYEIHIADVKHLYNLQDESNAYAYLQKAVKKFEGAGFRLKEDEGTDIYYPWFSKIKYQKKRGDEGRSKIVLDLHPEVKQMIMSAKQGAFYRIEYPLNLTKKYSKRLYYLLKDKENFNGGTFIISFSELRKMMKVPDSYANGNVKREILDKPYEEINGNTDISFEYDLIYEKLPSGQNSLGAVQFHVKKVKTNRTIVEYETIEKNGESVIATEEEQEIIDVFDCSIKEAKDILVQAYERYPGGRQIVYSLCELCIKTDDVVGAIEYYKEYDVWYINPNAPSGVTENGMKIATPSMPPYLLIRGEDGKILGALF